MKFKIGHRVITNYGDRGIVKETETFFNDDCIVLLDNGENTTFMERELKLDPNAVSFVNGDEVEVRDSDIQPWNQGFRFIGMKSNGDYTVERHGIISNYKCCRYPQPKSRINLNNTTVVIENQEYILKRITTVKKKT